MKNPIVSIIVPVYKAEKTLSRCVDSILSQTYPDFELLLIDDGSPDNSGVLCDAYAKRDSRIKVFHKPNGGVSSARNLGLDNAKGEWISFIDSDDWIDESFLDKALQKDSDIVILGNIDIKENNIKYQGGGMWNYKNGDAIELNRQTDYKKFIESNFLSKGILQVVWGKIIRRERINNLRFCTSMKIGEDVVFSLQLLKNCDTLTYIHGQYYFYNIPNLNVKYRMDIDEASLHLKNIVLNYENCSFNIPNYLKKELNEKLILSIRNIIKHPIKYLNSEGFILISKKINNKNPRIYLGRTLLNFLKVKIKKRLMFKKLG